MFLNIIIIFISIFLTSTIHEYGHYFFAKIFNIKINKLNTSIIGKNFIDVEYSSNKDNLKLKLFFVYIGGILSVFFFYLIIVLLIKDIFITGIYTLLFFSHFIQNMIPLNNNDGNKIYNLFKTKSK